MLCSNQSISSKEIERLIRNMAMSEERKSFTAEDVISKLNAQGGRDVKPFFVTSCLDEICSFGILEKFGRMYSSTAWG